MNVDAPQYMTRLREAQNLYRSREKTQAFKIARELNGEFPDEEVVKKFHDAVARSILALAKTKLQSENYEIAIHYAQLLLDTIVNLDTVRKIILEAARAGLSPENRAALLYEVCRGDQQHTPYWREMALCVYALEPSKKNIELGFDVLKALPGHTEALRGLSLLIRQHTHVETSV